MLEGMMALSEGFKIGTPPLRGEIPKVAGCKAELLREYMAL